MSDFSLSRRSVLGLPFAISTILSAGACTQSPIKVIPPEKATTRGVICAIQLATQARESGIEFGFRKERGFIILVHPNGNAQALDIGMIDDSHPLWNKGGLFFGGLDYEYCVTDEKLTAHKRGGPEHHEISRFSTADQSGFITMYNSGGNPFGGQYDQNIVIGDQNKVTYRKVQGLYLNVGYDNDSLYSVATTAYCPHLKTEAARVFQATGSQVTPGTEKTLRDGYDFLVRHYSPGEPSSQSVLAAVSSDSEGESLCRGFPMYNNCLYLPLYKRTIPHGQPFTRDERFSGAPLFQVWDLKKRFRTYMYMMTPDGNALDILPEDTMTTPGMQKENMYYLATDTGKVFSIDLTTGIGDHLFTIDDVRVENQGSMQMMIRDDYVYVMRPYGQDKRDQTARLSRYALSTGREEPLVQIRGLEPYESGRTYVWGFALRPDYENYLADIS
ncbi:hypothetical protein [Actinomyces vulturis]|uniref:hypothetical protein n=1 Tax=Actinomyces vulturis TaxID=1857645 RepID=UPI0008321547|nr:hypothetical protein [Actinomyces vulturis]